MFINWKKPEINSVTEFYCDNTKLKKLVWFKNGNDHWDYKYIDYDLQQEINESKTPSLKEILDRGLDPRLQQNHNLDYGDVSSVKSMSFHDMNRILRTQIITDQEDINSENNLNQNQTTDTRSDSNSQEMTK